MNNAAFGFIPAQRKARLFGWLLVRTARVCRKLS
jgi:hypothetical protein